MCDNMIMIFKEAYKKYYKLLLIYTWENLNTIKIDGILENDLEWYM